MAIVLEKKLKVTVYSAVLIVSNKTWPAKIFANSRKPKLIHLKK